MSWADPNGDLRLLIADGALDKYSFQKKVFGNVNSSNQIFKTLETRRTKSFSDPTVLPPVGIYINGQILPTTSITLDDPITGQFTLDPSVVPNNGDIIEASYYYQWFFDDEIASFLRQATTWAVAVSDYTNLTEGLQPCVLHYAAGLAYMKVSLWFARHLSEQYRVEDMPDEKRLQIASQYSQAANEELTKIAPELRAQFYMRNDQYLSPLFRNVRGAVRTPQPKR